MEASQLKKLEEENRKLKQMYADLSLDNVILKDVIAKNWGYVENARKGFLHEQNSLRYNQLV